MIRLSTVSQILEEFHLFDPLELEIPPTITHFVWKHPIMQTRSFQSGFGLIKFSTQRGQAGQFPCVKFKISERM